MLSVNNKSHINMSNIKKGVGNFSGTVIGWTDSPLTINGSFYFLL